LTSVIQYLPDVGMKTLVVIVESQAVMSAQAPVREVGIPLSRIVPSKVAACSVVEVVEPDGFVQGALRKGSFGTRYISMEPPSVLVVSNSLTVTELSCVGPATLKESDSGLPLAIARASLSPNRNPFAHL
jgi:hypothetical protein